MVMKVALAMPVLSLPRAVAMALAMTLAMALAIALAKLWHSLVVAMAEEDYDFSMALYLKKWS